MSCLHGQALKHPAAAGLSGCMLASDKWGCVAGPLAPLYYRGASAACVAYDITSAESFQKAKHWVSELQKNASGAIGKRCSLRGT